VFKKWLIGILATLSVLVVIVYVNQEALTIALIKSQIGPEHDFDRALLPPAPDYTQTSAWAALPAID
jgi:hypothetical protein